eukprot:SM000028S10167  [mRNA]  locus=s28:769389:773247:- [translate_table: standard]
MPSFWWSNGLADGATVQLETYFATWWDAYPASNWTSYVTAMNTTAPPVSTALTIHRLSASQVMFQAPTGAWLKANMDSGKTIGVTSDDTDPAAVFTIQFVGDEQIQVKAFDDLFETKCVHRALVPLTGVLQVLTCKMATHCSCNGSCSQDGWLARWGANAYSWETFTVREAMQVPAIRGVNLGGWLVYEAWMQPDLFTSVPVLIDGTQDSEVSLWQRKQSDDPCSVPHRSSFSPCTRATGWWLKTAAVHRLVGRGPEVDILGCQVLCNRNSPSGWETFNLRRTDPSGVFQLRVFNEDFWSMNSGNGLLVVADQLQAGSTVGLRFSSLHPRHPSASRRLFSQAPGLEDFRFVANPNNSSLIMIQAPNGMYLRATASGNITADVDPASVQLTDPAAWQGPTAFYWHAVSIVDGEYQLVASSGENATSVMTQHHSSFITEADFQYLKSRNINAVRVPVGYWMASNESPFVAGTEAYLDQAFAWAELYDVRIMISFHAAPGSQNGYEHSAARDGKTDWAYFPENVAQSLDAIDWLSSRYAQLPMFLGIGLLNEPLGDYIPMSILQDYYTKAYDIVRSYSPCAYVSFSPLTDSPDSAFDDFMTVRQGYNNVIFDAHVYHVFDGTFTNKSAAYNIDYTRTTSVDYLKGLEKGGHLVMVGEWSLAMYGDAQATSQDTADFGTAQLETYGGTSAGWFFWSLKVNRWGYNEWNFQKSDSYGWLQQKPGGGWP